MESLPMTVLLVVMLTFLGAIEASSLPKCSEFSTPTRLYDYAYGERAKTCAITCEQPRTSVYGQVFGPVRTKSIYKCCDSYVETQLTATKYGCISTEPTSPPTTSDLPNANGLPSAGSTTAAPSPATPSRPDPTPGSMPDPSVESETTEDAEDQEELPSCTSFSLPTALRDYHYSSRNKLCQTTCLQPSSSKYNSVLIEEARTKVIYMCCAQYKTVRHGYRYACE